MPIYFKQKSTKEETNNIHKNAIVPANAGQIVIAADTIVKDLNSKLDSVMEPFGGEEYKLKCMICGKATKGISEIARSGHEKTLRNPHYRTFLYLQTLC